MSPSASKGPARARKPSPAQAAALRCIVETGFAGRPPWDPVGPHTKHKTAEGIKTAGWAVTDAAKQAAANRDPRVKEGWWVLTDAGAAALARVEGRPEIRRATEAWLLRQPYAPMIQGRVWAHDICRHCGCRGDRHLDYNGHCPATEARGRAKEAPRVDLPDAEYDRAAEAYWTARDTYFEART